MPKVDLYYAGVHLRKTVNAGIKLSDILLKEGMSVSMPCGGNGKCGKCVITFKSGAPAMDIATASLLTGEQILSGKRLLCKTVINEDCEIIIDDKFSGEDKIAAESVEAFPQKRLNAGDIEDFYIAIDLGTTTVAMALVGKEKTKSKYEVISSVSGINHQRQYGADVISRIAAAGKDGNAAKLRKLILDDFLYLIEKLIKDGLNAGGFKSSISGIFIAGNTTMLHLLRGYDVSGLGSYPYKTQHLNFEIITVKELFKDENSLSLRRAKIGKYLKPETKVTLLPGISAFVGADIVSGIYYLDIISKKGTKTLFLDLGTNGEMAYFDGKKLTVTSTAAGPVFEGGGISCGTASIPGAISHVKILNYKVEIITIDDEKPIGICGTGVMEAVAELVRTKNVGTDGLLKEEFFDEGFVLYESPGIDKIIVRITQQDIRNVQLAKAAICTGINKLTKEDIPDVVYVAGGFGTHIDIESIKTLGLFPDVFDDKIEAVGNTSLKGLIKFIDDIKSTEYENGDAYSKIAEITDNAEELVLAMENDFGEQYIKSLDFRI